jgi:cytosine/uracil/thiamine/allantoin permease
MATPLDVGLLQKFDIIFPFIFVLVIVYAFLTRTEWFKEKQGIALMIAFVLGVMTLFSSIAIKTINKMAPWFILLIVFAILLILAYQAMGVGEKTILDVITSKEHGTTIAWWVLSLMLMIGLGSLSAVVSEEVKFTQLAEGENATIITGEGEQVGFWATLFHPKVLGLALILLIAMFTIQKLAAKPD